MSMENLSSLTVVELRKLAKENNIKLGTGISKELIIEKITAGLSAERPVEPEAALEAPKAAGWANAAHNYSTKPAYQAPAYQPRPAWQNRQQPVMRQPAAAPSVQEEYRAAPQKPAYTPRFGPSAGQPTAAPAPERPAPRPEPEYRPQPAYQNSYETQQRRPRRDASYFNAEFGTSNPAVPEMLQAGECSDGEGLLEIHPDGYGFLRPNNFIPGQQDIYVSMAQIRRFDLRTGDYVTGKTRPQRDGDKYSALLYITDVNGQTPDELTDRPNFDQLTPIYPDRRIELSEGVEFASPTLRMMDLVVPIGYGQRGLIIAPPQTGKRRILIELANAITQKYENAHVMLLLIDIRPEDVTEVKDHVRCEVLSSTFDRSPETHARVAEMVSRRAQRLCELKKDVVVLVDSLTLLARAYNNISVQQGRGTPGMLNPGMLYKSKKLFGTARNLREGGSLTVIGTLAADTGNKMDDAIAEEFKGTATMELYLTRELSEQGVYPAFDLIHSNTRRDELLISKEQQDGLKSIRSLLSSSSNTDAVKQLIEMMQKTTDNEDLLRRLKEWIILFKRGGIPLGR